MLEQKLKDIVTPELERGAIYNDEYEGFHEDYLVLHCLIRKYKPKTFFEIGTNMGTGTNIICNAMRYKFSVEYFGNDTISDNHYMQDKVFSLDLPTELAHISLQHPISEGKGDKVGERCTFPFTQLRGDSLKFDFSQYPCQGYFIDGEHDYEHPYAESVEVFNLNPKIIIWHDSDIPEVWKAISEVHYAYSDKYDLFRVTDTRIAYALRK